MSLMSEESSKHDGFVWSDETVKEAMELVKDLGDKYLTYKKDESEAIRKEAEERRHYFETVSKHNQKMVYVLVSFLAVVVAFMTVLTGYKLVSGDALLFLVGTITGYLLLFIQRLVFSSHEEPPTEEIPT
jgi:hypothetical protein